MDQSVSFLLIPTALGRSRGRGVGGGGQPFALASESSLSLSSPLQGPVAYVGRLTSMWVPGEAESLGGATGTELGSPGPIQGLARGRDAILSS